ncbi:Gfo/Idh/MocA family protein [Streptomyces sp. BH097]|uniref:Gfo/Idh/MocA family protein n=1 Tax=unclassified Streptomyces TaxID=2593676 RepID=UPI003BB6A1BE
MTSSTPPTAPGPARFGLVGTGSWAQRTYAPTLEAHKSVDLVGIWGRRPQAAAELADAHGTTAYADVDALFTASDVVAFAVPPDVQAPLAARAAAAGCHLLLDKPLATRPDAARAVVEAADAAGVASTVFCTLRHAPLTAAWIAEQAGTDGWFTGRGDWFGALYTPGDDAQVRATTPWRAEKGALWDVGPHALSVLLPILGAVRTVAAHGGPGDTVHLVLRHAGGASSTATLSLTTPPAAGGVAVELRGTEGVSAMPTGTGVAQEALAAAIDALLEAVRGGPAHPCDARFGLRLTQTLAAAERSLASGRAEPVPEH